MYKGIYEWASNEYDAPKQDITEDVLDELIGQITFKPRSIKHRFMGSCTVIEPDGAYTIIKHDGTPVAYTHPDLFDRLVNLNA